MEFKIVCPYCNNKHDGLAYIELNDMEGTLGMRCEKCERQFLVEFKTSIQFKIEKSE